MKMLTAVEAVASAWCAPATLHKDFDVHLAQAFLHILKREVEHREDILSYAWTLLANVSGGDWTKQSPDWQNAVKRWREHYFSLLSDRDRVYYLMRCKRAARLRSIRYET